MCTIVYVYYVVNVLVINLMFISCKSQSIFMDFTIFTIDTDAFKCLLYLSTVSQFHIASWYQIYGFKIMNIDDQC